MLDKKQMIEMASQMAIVQGYGTNNITVSPYYCGRNGARSFGINSAALSYHYEARTKTFVNDNLQSDRGYILYGQGFYYSSLTANPANNYFASFGFGQFQSNVSFNAQNGVFATRGTALNPFVYSATGAQDVVTYRSVQPEFLRTPFIVATTDATGTLALTLWFSFVGYLISFN